MIKNARLVNENEIREGDVMISQRKNRTGGFIHQHERQRPPNSIDADGHFLLPGIIDDQVHFREPGLTHKGDLFTESRAAVAGGITSFMEQPNTKPPATTIEELEKEV